MDQLKNKLYDIKESVDEGIVERYAISIYNRIEACFESNWYLANYSIVYFFNNFNMKICQTLFT